MAKLTTKTKFLIKKCKEPKEAIKLTEKVSKELKADVKLMNSNEFLKAMNISTKRLYIRDIPKKEQSEVFKINEDLKRDYEGLEKKLRLKDKDMLSKNTHNVREVYTILSIRDNLEVYLEQGSLIKTIKLLRDEIKVMELIKKELMSVHKIKEEKEPVKKEEPHKDKMDKNANEFGWKL